MHHILSQLTWLIAAAVLVQTSPAMGRVWYVKWDASGANSGENWGDAFTDLQSALSVAQSGDEIWVAAGTYRPSVRRVPSEPRSASFRLVNGVCIYGGFVGSETNRGQRKFWTNVTILNGDLNADDGPGYVFAHPDPPWSSDNCDWVVDGSATTLSARLDGMAITRGYHGVALLGGSPVISNCTFLRNLDGAAIGMNGGATPQIVNCRFLGNGRVGPETDVSAGAALSVNDSPTSALAVNCEFVGNSANAGAAVLVRYGAQVTLINCTFAANQVDTAPGRGGSAVWSYNSSFSFVNCILGDQTIYMVAGGAGHSSYSAGLHSAEGPSMGSYSEGPGVVRSSPLFARDPSPGMDGKWGSADDDYGDLRLQQYSPCIDSGSNSGLLSDIADLNGNGNTSEVVPVDLDGHARRIDDPTSIDTGSGVTPFVDMGAYEGGSSRFILFSANPLAVLEGSTASVGVSLSFDPGRSVTVVLRRVLGDADVTIPLSSSLTFDSTNYNLPQSVVLAAAEDADADRGTAIVTATAAGWPEAAVTAIETDNEAGAILFVKADAGPGGDGLTWGTACDRLEDALSTARTADGFFTEIWVASGTYRPTARTNPLDPRSVTFRLVEGVSAYGGFAGTETSRVQRSVGANVTVLSGDLNGDDGPNWANNGENAYRVVDAGGTSLETVFEGFVVTGGYANNAVLNGAGIYIGPRGLTVANCTFLRNRALDGGGLQAYGDFILSGCKFLSNWADEAGGGSDHGVNGIPTLRQVVNCVYVGNYSPNVGGAINLAYSAETHVVNCTFYGNSAPYAGGAIRVAGGAVSRVRNCIFWTNTSPPANSAGLYCDPYGPGTTLDTQYSNLDGEHSGSGNISNPPLFEDPDGSDDILGTLDDDLRLQQYSPCIDAGINAAVAVGVDILGHHRRFDSPSMIDTGSGVAPVVDMGAYEYGSEPLGDRLYVNGSATGSGTGVEWTNALTELQPALLTALVAGDQVREIWVAGGTYRPAGTGGPQSSAFRLLSGLSVYGGFAGTEAELAERDPAAHPTILSGDLNGNDDPGNLATYSDNVSHVVDASSTNATAVLDGVTISGGNADGTGNDALGSAIYAPNGKPTLTRVRLQGNRGPGFYGDFGQPQISGLTLADERAGLLTRTQSYLGGDLNLAGGTGQSPSSLELQSSRFEGPGHIDLAHTSRLWITNSPIYDPSRLLSDVTGTGTIEIATGQYLVVGGSAIVDLSGDGQCRPGLDDPSRGRIDVKGSLIVQDAATIQNTKVDVTLAEFKGNNDIVNNNIKLLEASTGFGGEFFASGQSTVRCNTILSEGDRYLDLDPDPIAPERPMISDNLIYVKIKEGILGSQGTLLELRTQDHDLAVGQGHSGAYKLPSSPGYADTWVLEEVEILPGAKLNLTNRQGFEFQPPSIGEPETVYVKKLKLHPGAILNTALQRLYYQELVDEHDQPLDAAKLPDTTGRQILDLPLLGFSLAIIRMDDANEFGIRTRLRTRDDQDTQPQPPAPALEGSIERLNEGDGGLMEMRTRAEGKQSASSIAAKGSFSRAGEETVVVSFDYRFVNAGEANDAEITVKLSDKSEVGTSNYEVGRVRPPAPGEPGAVGGSDYALYYIEVPYEEWSAHLGRFNRGTYVELELRGKGAVVRIDNWDPQVICSYTCADFTKNGVSTDDFLILLAEYGRSPAQTGHSCLDMYLSRDQHLDLTDLLSWDTYVAGGFNSCTAGGVTLNNSEPAKPPITTATFAPRSFVISGKPKTAGDQQDRIYTFNASGAQAGSQNPWTTPSAAPVGYRGNGRLIRDGQGNVYQLHAKQGLVRASDGVTIIPSKSRDTGGLKWQNRPVSVGVTPGSGTNFTGVPVTDVTFDPKDPNAVYVTPVLVWVASPAHVYRATAKLILDPNQPGQYSLAAVYGADPWTDPLATTTSPPEASYSATRLRELEIDRTGTRLFVTSSRADNGNEWLLIYDLQAGSETRHRLTGLAAALRSPTAMLASSRSDKLYLASADQASAWKLYRLDISGSSPVYEGDLVLPAPPTGYARQVTTISEDPSSGKLLLLGFELPVFPDTKTFSNSDALFTTPLLLTITPADPWPTSGIQTTPLSGSDLALPVSMVYVAGNCPADFNNDGRVDSTDLEIFVDCAAGPEVSYNPAALPSGCAPMPLKDGTIAADFDKDQDVDAVDFAEFQRALTR